MWDKIRQEWLAFDLEFIESIENCDTVRRVVSFCLEFMESIKDVK